MGDRHDGYPLVQFSQKIKKVYLKLRVYTGGRFIQEEDLRIGGKGPGNKNPLPLSA